MTLPRSKRAFPNEKEITSDKENVSNDSIKRLLNDLVCSFMSLSWAAVHSSTICPAVYTLFL